MTIREQTTKMTPEEAEAKMLRTFWDWLNSGPASETVDTVINRYAWRAAVWAGDTTLDAGYVKLLKETYRVWLSAQRQR